MAMINAPKGVEDILFPRASYYEEIEKKAGNFFSLYGYKKIMVPTFEKTELFLRSVGQETDVGKQMYTFKDKGGRSISLRPEGTAGIVRAYVEHKIYAKEKNWKVYYAGPMFRYERPQAGRLREFYQIGVECFGEESPWLDVEIIEMAHDFLKGMGLDNIQVQVNSIGCKKCRYKYIEELKVYLGKYLDVLCSTCRRRFRYNPLRILDCKSATCRAVLEKAPRIQDFTCSSCQEHFDKVTGGLCRLKIAHTINPYLVRGLDYYTRTIFEIISSYLGSQDAVCAGGRYDDLVEQLGGPPTPATGFAIGVERLLFSLEKAGVDLSKPAPQGVFMATIGEKSVEEAIQVASIIRSQGIAVKINLTNKGLSSQLKQANRENFSWVLIIGEGEIRKGKFILKNMHSGMQQEIETEEFEVFSNFLKGDASS